MRTDTDQILINGFDAVLKAIAVLVERNSHDGSGLDVPGREKVDAIRERFIQSITMVTVEDEVINDHD